MVSPKILFITYFYDSEYIFFYTKNLKRHNWSIRNVINIVYDIALMPLPIATVFSWRLFKQSVLISLSRYQSDIDCNPSFERILIASDVVKLKSIIPFHNNSTLPSFQNEKAHLFYPKKLETKLFLNTSVSQ